MKASTAETSLGVEYVPKLTRTAPVVVVVVVVVSVGWWGGGVVVVGRRSLGLVHVWPLR